MRKDWAKSKNPERDKIIINKIQNKESIKQIASEFNLTIGRIYQIRDLMNRAKYYETKI